jgi:hypothetical protein
MENKAKKVPDCKLEIVEVDGKFKVKASCSDDAEAMILKEVLDNEPVTIEVKAKTKLS